MQTYKTVPASLISADEDCYACNLSEDQDRMLVCDHCLKKCCHIDCLQPKLAYVPDEPWYCDFCIRDHNLRCSLPSANLFVGPVQRQNRGRRRSRYEEAEEISANYTDLSAFEQQNRREGSSDEELDRDNSHLTRQIRRNERRQRAVQRQREITNISRNISRSTSNASIRDPNTLRFIYDHNFAYNEGLLQRRGQRETTLNHRQRRANNHLRPSTNLTNGTRNRSPQLVHARHTDGTRGDTRGDDNHFQPQQDESAFEEEFNTEPSSPRQRRVLRITNSDENLF